MFQRLRNVLQLALPVALRRFYRGDAQVHLRWKVPKHLLCRYRRQICDANLSEVCGDVFADGGPKYLVYL